MCHPEGETDSETAFCHVLASIAGDYDTTDHSRWLARLSAVAEAIAATGKFNFLLSDNRFLIAYGHDHLYYLDHDDGQHRYALVSTEPLTDEDWCCFSAGELRVYRDGALFANHVPPRIFQDANKIADLSRVLS